MLRLRRIKNLEKRREQCSALRIEYSLPSLNFSDIQGKDNYFDFEDIFGREKPLVLEIGCGKGQFVCEYAKRYPDKNILAVECVRGVLVEACEMALRENIPNIRFLEMKAEYLPYFIKKNSVSEIYLNFSTPYPKAKQEKHRLTSAAFLEIYKKILCPNGFIAQKTDSREFFEYSIESFSQNGFALSEISSDLHNSGFDGNIITEYEQKFVGLGMPIYRLVAQPAV